MPALAVVFQRCAVTDPIAGDGGQRNVRHHHWHHAPDRSFAVSAFDVVFSAEWMIPRRIEPRGRRGVFDPKARVREGTRLVPCPIWRGADRTYLAPLRVVSSRACLESGMTYPQRTSRQTHRPTCFRRPIRSV